MGITGTLLATSIGLLLFWLILVIVHVRMESGVGRFGWAAALLVTAGAIGLAIWQLPARAPAGVPRQALSNGFVGSNSCRECHVDNHRSWHASFHRTMTQWANPTSVVGKFDVTLESDGQQCRLERRGDEFWAVLPDPEWEANMQARNIPVYPESPRPQSEQQIVMTTGSHHFQVYWMKSRDDPRLAPGHRFGLRQLPWYWSIHDQMWIPAIHTGLQPHQPGQSLQTPVFWNEVCIKCHVMGGQPGVDEENMFRSQFAELGISCEACHGPGEKHVRHHRSRNAAAPEGPDPTIVNPSNESPQVAAQICGQCHSSFEPVDPEQFRRSGVGYFAPADLTQTHTLDDPQTAAPPINNSFWREGTCRVGGDEYNALIDSPCYVAGKLTCISCHSMHNSDPNDQLADRMDGNEACLQCHEQMRDRVSEHTHHAPESSGSSCYNCHMPYTSYALLKAIRSHRVESPDLVRDHAAGKPNACNLCHLDKTLAWSSQHLNTWYDLPEPELDEDEKQIAASMLWLFKGDAFTRAIVTWHFGWEEARQTSGEEWMGPILARLMRDPYAAVRYVAHGALRQLPGLAEFPFTYYAQRQELERVSRRAAARWQELHGSDAPPRPELLLQAGARWDEEAARRLLNLRDNRPISVAE